MLYNRLLSTFPGLSTLCQSPSITPKIISALSSYGNTSTTALTRLASIGDSKRTPSSLANVLLSYLLLLKYATPDDIYALVDRIAERVNRCDSAQKQAYVMLIQTGVRVLERPTASPINSTPWDTHIPHPLMAAPPSTPTLPSPASSLLTTSHELTALTALHTQIIDYLDTHKELAFKSSLHEPARFYYNIQGNHHHRDHVNVHGVNGWLCLLRGWFGCNFTLTPLSTDHDAYKGCSDIWNGLSGAAWREFGREENFGKVSGRSEAKRSEGRRCEQRRGGGG